MVDGYFTQINDDIFNPLVIVFKAHHDDDDDYLFYTLSSQTILFYQHSQIMITHVIT